MGRTRMQRPRVMKANQRQKCCKLQDGALKVHTGRRSAKDMRTNILRWDKRTQMSIRAWAKITLISILTWVSNMRISTLVLGRLTQTSMDASHSKLNRASLYTPSTALKPAAFSGAHSDRRLFVPV